MVLELVLLLFTFGRSLTDEYEVVRRGDDKWKRYYL